MIYSSTNCINNIANIPNKEYKLLNNNIMTNLTTIEHFEKYDNLVQKYQLKNHKLPFKVLINHYKADKHLNSIPLKKWDVATFNLPNVYGISLAEKVCILKHIAIYHILKCKPKFN